MKKLLVIIPTYNERENVERMVFAIQDLGIAADILIVDDNSPDGTAGIVKQLQAGAQNVHLIERTGKMGLGTAYVEGFRFAIQHQYDFIFQMDCDFSHDPAELPNFINAMEHADLVIGSRYLHGMNVVNWPLKRLLLSYGANVYTRIVTGIPVKDSTGGFKCFRRSVLEAVALDDVHAGGYAFQIEMNYRSWKKGFRIKEIPIVFTDRIEGISKMSKHIIWEAIWLVWRLRLLSIFNRL